MRRGTTKPITCTVDRDFTNYPVVELTLTDGHYKLTFNWGSTHDQFLAA